MKLTLVPKERKEPMKTVSTGLPISEYNALIDAINNQTTIADCIRQLIKNFINSTKV